MSAKLLINNAFWSLLSHILSRGSMMLTAVILARTLNTAGFAAYSYFQITISMLGGYIGMGLGISASRFFAEVGHEEINNPPPPLRTLWCISLISSILGFILIMFTPNVWLNAGLNVPRWLFATGVFIVGLSVVPGGAILGLERYKQASLISAISGTILVMGAWLASERASPIIAMCVIVLSMLLQLLGESVVVIRAIGWRRIFVGFRLPHHEVRQVFLLAGPMFLASLFSGTGSWLLGRMILRAEGGEHAFSLYVIGLQWFSLGLFLPGIISRVILPRLVRISSINTSENEGKKIVLQATWMATSVSVVVALFGVFLGPWIFLIYGGSYESNRWFIAAFLGAAVLSAPANTVGNAIVAKAGQNTWLLLMFCWFVVLLVIGAVSLPMGALSGAIAQAAAAATLTLLAISTARLKKLI